MNDLTSDLRSLAKGGSYAPRPVVPKPARRWKTRVLVPLAILVTAVGLLAYSARSTFRSAVDVMVMPVIAKPLAAGEISAASTAPGAQGASESTTVIAQAPGWIEADPYAVSVPALSEGVVKEVLVLEGQRVETGQVVARLVDEDARLAVNSAAAGLAATEAERRRASAEVEAAAARAAETRDELERKRPLVAEGVAAAGPTARLELKLSAQEKEIESARASAALAEANVRQHEVMCEQARLTLSRMEIKSPAAGVVMARLVEPGTRISMANKGAGEMPGTIVRLYDPGKLQVRVDVPLADVAKIGVGTPAQIMTEAMPDTIFKGAVVRLVHEANIQRNTVQVKVAISNPSPTLKPEMLTRVRFYAAAPAGGSTQPGSSAANVSYRLLAPRAALQNVVNDQADALIVELASGSGGSVAALRHVRISGADRDGYCEVVDGLQPGLRLIVNPPAGLQPGMRVHVRGEATIANQTHEGM